MPLITFVQTDGRRQTIEVAQGTSFMKAAVDAGIEGIAGECGGSCACATCKIIFEARDFADLPAPEDMERSLIDGAQPGARLACQVFATSAMNDLVVTVPCQY